VTQARLPTASLADLRQSHRLAQAAASRGIAVAFLGLLLARSPRTVPDLLALAGVPTCAFSLLRILTGRAHESFFGSVTVVGVAGYSDRTYDGVKSSVNASGYVWRCTVRMIMMATEQLFSCSSRISSECLGSPRE